MSVLYISTRTGLLTICDDFESGHTFPSLIDATVTGANNTAERCAGLCGHALSTLHRFTVSNGPVNIRGIRT